MSPSARVAIRTGSGDGRELLAEAVGAGGLWSRLEEAPGPVVILVDGRRRDLSSPIGTNPEMVEHLVDLLAERGVRDVVVGLGPAGDDGWLENRDPVVVADLAGYRFITPAGVDYDVIALADDVVPAPVPPSSCLDGSRLPRTWIEAGFRICFSQNRTDEEFTFALCLQNLLDLLPERDRAHHYRGRLKPWDLAGDLLRFAPPHFAVIDAITSNHGRFGASRPRPIRTDTVIAGTDVLLVDFVAALKMGADPYASPLNGQALRQVGLPDGYEIDGPLDAYEGWVNPHPFVADALTRLSDSVPLAEARGPLVAAVDRELFPFTNQWLGRANQLVGRFADAADTNPAAYAWVAWLASAAAAGVQGLEAVRTLAAKDRVRWREVPLDLALDLHGPSDYEAVADYIEPLEDLVRAAPPDGRGLRWRLLDGSVLFEMSRDFGFDFDDFVERVDITKAIRLMYDYIGGRSVEVAREAGRVVHQAERNIYLPQPNWMVLYGGKPIDVSKLELIRYAAAQQKIMWRTVSSANQSAEFDDGSVTFTRTDGGTRVTVAARQKFALPASWQLFDVSLLPELTRPLIADSYGRFFDRTLDNFRAAYTGEEFRVGRPWPDERDLVAWSEQLGELRGRLEARVRDLAGSPVVRKVLGGSPGQPAAGELDDHGFVHVAPAAGRHGRDAGPEPAAPSRRTQPNLSMSGMVTFWSELAQAVAKDLGLAAGGGR